MMLAAALSLAVGGGLVGCDDASGPAPVASSRPPVELSSSVDDVTAEVGQILHYTLEVNHAEGLELQVPDIGAQMAGLSITDIEEPPPETRDGRVIRKRIYSLRADLAGSYPIPEVMVGYLTEDGQPATSIAPAVFIEVASPGEDGGTLELKDIKANIVPEKDRIPLILGAAALAVLAALAFVIYRLSRRPKLVPALPPSPPWVVARQELAALEARDLIRQGEHRLYFFELSEILRRYMERRFSVPAMEQTSEEVMRLFRKGGGLAGQVPLPLEDVVRQFLEGSDRIKYAKHVPEAAEVDALLGACQRFVDETVPRAPVEPEGIGGEAQA